MRPSRFAAVAALWPVLVIALLAFAAVLVLDKDAALRDATMRAAVARTAHQRALSSLRAAEVIIAAGITENAIVVQQLTEAREVIRQSKPKGARVPRQYTTVTMVDVFDTTGVKQLVRKVTAERDTAIADASAAQRRDSVTSERAERIATIAIAAVEGNSTRLTEIAVLQDTATAAVAVAEGAIKPRSRLRRAIGAIGRGAKKTTVVIIVVAAYALGKST